MCTATWLFNDNGYDLFFNRDELNTRKEAIPPILKSIHSISYLSPTDADEGGTWIAVNQFGLSLFLLNYYHADFNIKQEIKYKSRGLIIPDLINGDNPGLVFAKLSESDLSYFRPFILAVISSEKKVSTFSWNGTEKTINENVDVPLCSSSFKSVDVIKSRSEYFRSEVKSTISLTVDTYFAFHKSHYPDKNAFSVCMHRDDAHTVSICHVKVTRNEISLSYLSGNPCEGYFSPPILLDRVKTELS